MVFFSKSSRKDESSNRHGKFGIPRRRQKEAPGDEMHPEVAPQDSRQIMNDGLGVERTSGSSRPLTANPVARCASGSQNITPPVPLDYSRFDRRTKERSQLNLTSQASLHTKKINKDIVSSSANIIPKTEAEAYTHIKEIRSQKCVLDGDSNAKDLEGALELYVDGMPQRLIFN